MSHFARRSTAPFHSSTSAFIGFLTSTGVSEPRIASAISCTLNGFEVVRAPIQNISIPKASALSTCFAFATSIATGRPVCFFTSTSHGSAGMPAPSKPPGFVRGFQTPARTMSTLPDAAKSFAVSRVCSAVSAEHGPDIIIGFLDFKSNIVVSIFVILVLSDLLGQ